MELVTDRRQVAENIKELERVRSIGSGPEHRDYRSLIKLGTCFLPYESPSGLAFAPSRFLGYAGNTFSKHAANDAKDGRVTTPALSEVLGSPPEPDEELEEQYRAFCGQLGFEPRPTGNFGVQRKFWPRGAIGPLATVPATEEVG